MVSDTIDMKKISWQSKETAVFSGKIDYPKYRYWDRLSFQAKYFALVDLQYGAQAHLSGPNGVP